jgi:hypothetical protein
MGERAVPVRVAAPQATAADVPAPPGAGGYGRAARRPRRSGR